MLAYGIHLITIAVLTALYITEAVKNEKLKKRLERYEQNEKANIPKDLQIGA